MKFFTLALLAIARAQESSSEEEEEESESPPFEWVDYAEMATYMNDQVTFGDDETYHDSDFIHRLDLTYSDLGYSGTSNLYRSYEDETSYIEIFWQGMKDEDTRIAWQCTSVIAGDEDLSCADFELTEIGRNHESEDYDDDSSTADDVEDSDLPGEDDSDTDSSDSDDLDGDGDTDDYIESTESDDDDEDEEEEEEEEEESEEVVAVNWADYAEMSASVIFRSDRPFEKDYVLDASESDSEVELDMDKGTAYYISIEGLDSDLSGEDACSLEDYSSGTVIADGKVIIYGTVSVYEDTGSESDDSSDNEYMCGILVSLDEDLVAYDDELDLITFKVEDGSSDIEINLEIEVTPHAVQNEYLILALPREFENGDSFTLAFQVNYELEDEVYEIGTESRFDLEDTDGESLASTFYSHTFSVSADSDVVLQNTLYQPVTTIFARFMGNTGSDAVAGADENFQSTLLPYFSAPSVYSLMGGSAIVGNVVQTWIANQGLNTIAVMARVAKEVVPDIQIPMIPGGWSTHGVIDFVYEKTRSFAPMIGDMVNDALDGIMPEEDPNAPELSLPSLPF